MAICPSCHCLLPQGVEDGALSVAVVGARNSGKTVFLSQLDWQLMHTVPERFGVAVDYPGGTAGLASKLQEYRKKMTDGQRQLPEQTRVEGNRGQAPAVYRWDWGPARKRHASRVISIYDTPGEAVATLQRTTELGHLRAADAVVLVIDPFSLSENRELAREKGIDPGSETLANDVLDGLIGSLRYDDQNVGKGKLLTTPLAIAVTKMDAFWSQFPEGSPLRTTGEAVPYFDEEDSKSVHDFVLSQLQAWGGANLTNKIAANFKTFRYFAVSALGDEPSYRDGRLTGTVSPTRVVDPVLWILSGDRKFLPTDSSQSGS
ncbi:TRAFAC clade GTPase domain-containing protein [Kocuria tytonis]|uniref:TRAFAC clade GTPase domain-containing protein n=1 Tax=Kocuria tytonis TaxID=2054280 RepID=UPI001314788A|nr:hypothetical protein [Kocuria tytonis]